jgi:hypothetical protein
LFLRPLRARTLLDLAFSRIHLLGFFYPPALIELLQKQGVRAEFLSRKETNRLRSVRGLGAKDLPLHDGRAISYWVRNSQIYVGSMRVHEMIFNWAYPHSLVAQMADSISRAPCIDDPNVKTE